MANSKVAEIITERVLDMLNKGVVPWRKPWNTAGSLAPRNLRGRSYKGINVFLLAMAPFTDPRWGTYKQLSELGATVRKGEKGTPVIFWKMYEVDDPNPKSKTGKKKVPVLRYYTVFNVEQTEGHDFGPIPGLVEGTAHDPIEDAEAIVAAMPNRPELRVKKSDRAFYRPSEDVITVPELSQYDSPEEYYSTLFHELGHSTGHESRLNRTEMGTGHFGSGPYGREELVAEMTAALLCAEAGIANATVDNSVAYIAGWTRNIKEDANAVIVAAGKAQKAADYILGNLAAEAEEEAEEAKAA